MDRKGSSQKKGKIMKKAILFLLVFTSLFMTGCREKKKSIKVAATSVPHAEMLEVIKPDLEKQGYKLEILVIDDYQLPNRLLQEKQVDANFFQHQPFLDKEICEFGYSLTPIAQVHIEPLGIYSKKISSFEKLTPKALVTIPSDPSNEGRALRLLEEAKLIKLKENASLYATPLDIIENPLALKIKEIDAPLLPRTLKEVDLSVIPGNFALQASLSPSDALFIEGKNCPYVNILVVRKGEENREDLQALKTLLTSEKIRHFVEEKYKGKILMCNL